MTHANELVEEPRRSLSDSCRRYPPGFISAWCADDWECQRARQLANLVGHGASEMESPPVWDWPARLVAERWGTRAKRIAWDRAWLGLWHAVAAGGYVSPSAGIDNGGFFDARAQPFDLRSRLRTLFRSRAFVRYFNEGESYQEHRDLAAAHELRFYLFGIHGYKQRLSHEPFFGLGGRSPLFAFAQGNYSRNCLAFHAEKSDNSDIALTYLLDDAVVCLDIYDRFRPVGQAWLVIGELAGRGRIVLLDSVDIFPAQPGYVQAFVEPLRATLRRLLPQFGASEAWANLRVYTTSAARFAASCLQEHGIAHALINLPKPGTPRLGFDRAAVRTLPFCRLAPWRIAHARAEALGIEPARCYLDSWGGFVGSAHNDGPVFALPFIRESRV
jgi:hypothetical protein